MAAQHDPDFGAEEVEASVPDGVCSGTPRVEVLERRLQGLTVNMLLLME